MKSALVKILLLSILISSGYGKFCQEGQNSVWGMDYNYRVVSGTFSNCWGLLSCNEAICATYKLENVSFVGIQLSNDTNQHLSSRDKLSYSASSTCTEGPNFIFGLDSTYHIIPDTTTTCYGLLSCNEVICTLHDLPKVSFVAFAATHNMNFSQ